MNDDPLRRMAHEYLDRFPESYAIAIVVIHKEGQSPHFHSQALSRTTFDGDEYSIHMTYEKQTPNVAERIVRVLRNAVSNFAKHTKKKE